MIATEKGPAKNPASAEEEYRDSELYAWHYKADRDSFRLVDRVQDFIRDCPFDVEAAFIPGTIQVTDLDQNGHTEIWMMYLTACRSDVSPSNLKIILYEKGKKFALRGISRLQVNENGFEGGRYTFDPAFQQAPAAFRKFALDVWKKT
jgi:hypothetical protein